MKPIADIIGLPALLEQTAEECAELGKACLKLSRKLRGENTTPLTKDEILDNLNEEIADISLCIEELRVAAVIDPQTIESIYAVKERRWYERLEKLKE